jgi:biotin transporter BioY
VKELVNHFIFDSVSFQVLALVLFGFWLSARRGQIGYADTEPPRTFAGEALTLAVYQFMLIGVVALYYGWTWRTIGMVALWALHVGVLWFMRGMLLRRRSLSLRAFLAEVARFEAVASLGVLFLK